MSTAIAYSGPAATTAPESDAWKTVGRPPELVVSPHTAEEAAEVMKWATVEGLSVVPAGTGTHMPPRTIAMPWIALRTDRMTGIEAYEAADLTLTAAAGTPIREIDGALREHSQWLPFDPPGFLDRTGGGLVAVGISGPLWAGYGELRNHVLGATVVTGDGRVLRLGGRVVKNVAGFDLLKPMVGSRGILGLMTSVCFRAFPVPEVDRLLRIDSMDLVDLLAVALNVGTAPVVPASITLHVGEGVGSTPVLTVRLHGAEATVDADQKTIENHIGVRFETTDAAPAIERDSAATEVLLSVLPSRLPEAFRQIDGANVAFAVSDTYKGTIRLGIRDFDPEATRQLGAQIEQLGGALSVRRTIEGSDMSRLGSRPTTDEQRLEKRVTGVFDPEGVLWRTR